MLKQILMPYAAYNHWAHEVFCGTIQKLPLETQNAAIGGPFGTLEAVLKHLWETEAIWWQRLKLEERIVLPTDQFSGDVQAVCAALLKSSQQYKAWVGAATEAALAHTIEYRNNKRQAFKQPVYQILLHLFNHQTYHRGQMAHALRTLGVTLPATDFIVWSRK